MLKRTQWAAHHLAVINCLVDGCVGKIIHPGRIAEIIKTFIGRKTSILTPPKLRKIRRPFPAFSGPARLFPPEALPALATLDGCLSAPHIFGTPVSCKCGSNPSPAPKPSACGRIRFPIHTAARQRPRPFPETSPPFWVHPPSRKEQKHNRRIPGNLILFIFPLLGTDICYHYNTRFQLYHPKARYYFRKNGPGKSDRYFPFCFRQENTAPPHWKHNRGGKFL